MGVAINGANGVSLIREVGKFLLMRKLSLMLFCIRGL